MMARIFAGFIPRHRAGGALTRPRANDSHASALTDRDRSGPALPSKADSRVVDRPT